MYSALIELVQRRRSTSAVARPVPATVLFLGVTSMFTDISSEMVTAILPLYLTYDLSFTALQFGGFVGLAEGVQAMIRILGGVAADRRSDHKRIATAGYATSAVSRVAILAAGGAWVPTTGVLLADRFGKGIRTAPRDAMISMASPSDQLGRSFGVHRSLDALGAMLGPLLAFAILAFLGTSDDDTAYDAVFLVSFSLALVGLSTIVLFVRPAPGPAHRERFRTAVVGEVIRGREVRRFTVAAALLGVLTIGDAFIFLGYRRVADIRLEYFPLLFTGMSIVYLTTAVPIGRLADRIGRRQVFLAGYLVLAGVYLALFLSLPGPVGLVAVVGGLGIFYAATDGVLMAAVSELLGTRARATGLAVVSGGAAMGKLVAAVVFGALWTAYGPDTAFACFAAGVPLALVVSWRLFDPRRTSQAMVMT